jgi:hypothetical protein
LEFAIRQAVLSAGAKLLEKMVDGIGSGRQDEPVLCTCGCRMKSRGRKPKQIKTLLGDVTIVRSIFVCPNCDTTFIPADELLDVKRTGFSPGVRILMARAGQRDTFKEGSRDLKDFAEITVTAKDVERVAEGMGQDIEGWQMKERQSILPGLAVAEDQETIPVLYVSYDGTGVPIVPWETAGRKGKQKAGGSKTREVKLGCVFNQTSKTKKGFPIRDDDGTTFVGAIESSAEFGPRIYAEALRRGLNQAQKTVVLADGARYNWDIAARYFPDAVQIVDLYHAREHLNDLCHLLKPEGGLGLSHLQTRWRTMLDEGRVDEIIYHGNMMMPKRGKRREEIEKELGYFKNNSHRMNYADYRKQGLFVGSGVVEAGCKTLIGKRLKQSAMQWTVKGANSIIALRCCHLSGRMEDYLKKRAA